MPPLLAVPQQNTYLPSLLLPPKILSVAPLSCRQESPPKAPPPARRRPPRESDALHIPAADPSIFPSSTAPPPPAPPSAVESGSAPIPGGEETRGRGGLQYSGR